MRILSFKVVTLIVCACAALVLSSCGNPGGNERNHPLFVKARNFRNQSKYLDAAKYYEEYLLINPKSAAAHNELAMLYDDQLDKPMEAVYHFRQYLNLAPESVETETVTKWLLAAEKKYYLKLQEKYGSAAPGDSAAAGDLAALRAENAKLRQAVEALGKSAAQQHPETVQRDTPRQAPAPPKPAKKSLPEVYTIKKNDTLAKISAEVYGDSKHHRLIYDANRDTLSAPEKLTVGQKLRIPPVPAGD
jgi:LysM repeat protein